MSADTRQKLRECFKAVFASLSDSELERASMASVAEWDSVATLTLLAVVEEAFGEQIPTEELENLVSFELFARYFEARS